MSPTPHSSFMDSISRWEGEWQADPNDSGNWVVCPTGRKLIGTMRGVTPAALAQHLNLDPCDLYPAFMKDRVTLALAAEIGMKGYYHGPGFDKLRWSPLVAIAADIGWGSGPNRAIKMLQDLIGASADGKIGPRTKAAYDEALADRPMGELVDALTQVRRDFYLRISEPGSKNHKCRKGWLRRADYYTTSNAEWWSQWAGPVTTPSDPKAAARARILAATEIIRQAIGEL